jgi:hypothetical protein
MGLGIVGVYFIRECRVIEILMEMRRAEKSRNLFVEMGFVSEWECLLLPFFLKELTFLLSHLGGI